MALRRTLKEALCLFLKALNNYSVVGVFLATWQVHSEEDMPDVNSLALPALLAHPAYSRQPRIKAEPCLFGSRISLRLLFVKYIQAVPSTSQLERYANGRFRGNI